MTTLDKNNVFSARGIGLQLCMVLIFNVFAQHFVVGQTGLQLNTDRPTAYYKVGETITFVAKPASGTLEYEIFYDQYTPVLESSTVQAIGSEARITFQLQEPGIVKCRVKQGNQTALAAAAVDPYQITALEPEPPDFDAFWQTAKDELRAVPMDAQLSQYDSDEYSTTYRINLAHIDNRRIYGYISIPKGQAPYPAILTLPPFGAAPNIVKPQDILATKAGVISISIGIHNAPPDQQDPNAYKSNDLAKPEEYYDRQAVLAGIRAIDYLFTRFDFNGKVGIVGVSQGGGLGLMTAGIDDRVDFLALSTATHCQHLGLKYDKASGFPNYLNQAKAKNAGHAFEESVAEASKYFDAIYFAKRYRGPILTFINYLDDVTAAATEFAAFNQIQGMKILLHSPRLGHQHDNEYWNGRYEFFRQLLPKARHAPWPWNPDTEGYFIDAGASVTTNAGTPITLSGQLTKNDTPLNNIAVNWEKLAGPGNVDFHTPDSLSTKVTFNTPGRYVLRLSANDYSKLEEEQQYYSLLDEVTVTVNGSTTALQLDCAEDFNLQARPDGKSPPIQWAAPVASTTCSDNDIEITQIDGPTLGQRLSPGTYTVRYQATNFCSDTTTCSFQITVTEAANLQLVCPDDLQFTLPESANSKTVEWEAPTVETTCPEGATVTQTGGPVSGNALTPGTYTIHYAATNDCGNTATCSFTIKILQNSSIEITCPEDISKSLPSNNAPMYVTWSIPLVHSTCSNLQPAIRQTAGPDNGSFLEPGTHTVEYEARDSCGNVANCTFSITITPETSLELHCPNDLAMTYPADSLPVHVTWELPQVLSTCSEEQMELEQIAGPLPNTLLAEGTYTVTYVASDHCGKTDTCSFTIEVQEKDSPSTDCQPGGRDPLLEWISMVNLNGVQHESTYEGYADFTHVNIPLTIGHNYRLRIKGRFYGVTFKEHWKVWIDFDKDGIFQETETVLTLQTDEPSLGIDNILVEQVITVPASAKAGPTTMRIAMRRDDMPTPCEQFENGEVEDYTIELIQVD